MAYIGYIIAALVGVILFMYRQLIVLSGLVSNAKTKELLFSKDKQQAVNNFEINSIETKLEKEKALLKKKKVESNEEIADFFNSDKPRK